MRIHFRCLAVTVMASLSACADDAAGHLQSGIAPDPVGAHELTIVSPTVLELSLITTKPPAPARVAQWDFVSDAGELKLPKPADFKVLVEGAVVPVREAGFRRRVTYAPLQTRDLRIGNSLFLRLEKPIRDAQKVEVQSTAKSWPPEMQFTATADPLRFSPAIHVNQVGYLPAFPKTAMAGYFLGSLGELDEPQPREFALVDVKSRAPVFRGKLVLRPDKGFSTPVYQHVLEADFTDFKTPGEYWLQIPGLGRSASFRIHDGAAAAVARTYALGLYHQRCGTSNALPFTRFTHAPCHVKPAAVPNASFARAEEFLGDSSSDCTNNTRHTARPLKRFASSLHPFVKRGPVDVSGGHHDAGDYSKYTINSAGLVHALVFSADALPGVGALDNLGLPESGDGKSDLLQEAKWETDFLVKMQDDDGGFYFLIYPRERRYENDVPPERGDAQIVWPKNTAATAAAVAALAQTASSPLFKKQFPEAAERYLATARRGWQFLTNAIAKHGRDGAYQKLTHYGDDFMHDDELAWAACELFLATGEEAFHQQLRKGLAPDSPEQRRWGWWRLYESYGRAIRSYAFAAQTGRVTRERLDAALLRQCENELLACADDQLQWAEQSAYGTSFPSETKRFGGGGWYFSLDQAFDLAAGAALDIASAKPSRAKYIAAILSNLNYEAGGNPVNVCYLTGLGWNRPSEVVHQFAQNDRRKLPPDGIPIGNVQAAFMWLDHYQDDLKNLSFPSDESGENNYPLYDRWSDAFNVQTEFVAVNQARALGAAAFLMAQTELKSQPWKFAAASIAIRTTNGTSVATLDVPQLPIEDAQVIWEAQGQEPKAGREFPLPPGRKPAWLEAEACWPDGRRAFATKSP